MIVEVVGLEEMKLCEEEIDFFEAWKESKEP